MQERYPFEKKSVEELIRKANENLKNLKEMLEEEEIEDDADGGYFQEDD